MGGGLLQLVAYGAQDVYLTGNPQITFFKVVYRRHTNFALESIQQTFNGSVGFGSRVTCTISRNGDLISRTYLVVKTNSTNSCPYFGLRLIQYAELEIGGQKIDKHYSDWMYIWNELSLPQGKKDGYFSMVGGSGGASVTSKTLYIPLEFWFCRNVGLALPLIGLQYHEVKINIQFETAPKLGVVQATAGAKTILHNDSIDGNLEASLWVDYIYLDTDERRKFAQSSHEYLIEQLQFTGKEGTQKKVKLNFNHPVKELVWIVTKDAATNINWFNYTNSVFATLVDSYADISSAIGSNSTATNPISTGKLILNGNDRFSQRQGSYFNLVQPFQHHENVPNNTGINLYSFALKPEEHQPSGTLNMSRIDTSTLDLEYENAVGNDSSIAVYAINYNVLRILSGMGGIAYSN
jgi:hypothetical protein